MACKTFCIATTWALWLALANLAIAAAETHEPIKATPITSQIPLELITRESRQYDAGFAVSAKTVLYKLKQKQKLTLVDVRRPQEFARLKIPGSINIPLYAVKTKSFLKSTPIIMINEGYGYRQLEQEGRRLAERGLKVSILDGGLPAWKRKGGQLVGDLFVLDAMKTVSPQVFFREKDYENALVLDISSQRSEAASQFIPYAKHLPILDDADGSMPGLRQLVSKYKNRSFFSVLLFNASGKQYAKAEKYLNRMGLDTFYLQGGLDGYQKYLEGLLLSWKPRDSRIKTVSNCKPCGKKSEAEIFQTGK